MTYVNICMGFHKDQPICRVIFLLGIACQKNGTIFVAIYDLVDHNVLLHEICVVV